MGEEASGVPFELKLAFLRELEKSYREARGHYELLLRHPEHKEALAGITSFCHKLAGTAESVGLHVLGRLANAGETVAQWLGNGVVLPRDSSLRLFGDVLEGAASCLEEKGLLTVSSERRSFQSASSTAGLLQPSLAGDERVLSKVLIVDDDPFSARMIHGCLRDAGFLSSYCCDANEALNIVISELPDLIVLDVAMPGMDGFNLCRRVRSHPALQFTPVIFVTRRGDLEQRVKGLEVGGNDYIAKPFEPQELVARVRSHLVRLAELRSMAVRDGLTRCFNHKYFKMRLEQEAARALRYEEPLTVAMLDIDHFKQVNDRHGHPTGDEVLRHLANVVMATVRSTDVVARYGGEEFGLLFVQSGLPEASIIANRIRERVAKSSFAVEEASVQISVSIGLAQYAAKEDITALIKRADSALYRAKEGGRNQVAVDSPA
ncbi:MAG TPA: diguanylate cyclase [Kofleriaceae bacterium]